MTPDQLRQCGEAMIAASYDKPVETMTAEYGWTPCINPLWLFSKGYLYRPAPEPAPPLLWSEPDDVPPVCWLKENNSGAWPCLVVEVREEGVAIGSPSLLVRWRELNDWL